MKLSRSEQIFLLLLALLLWAYILLRTFSVFYVSDELVTKWAYMIDWNFLPHQGYVDANNHFLLSFLGGLLVRIFHSDAMALIRLPVALSFPLFAWSTYRLGLFFRSRWSLHVFYVVMLSCPLFLEFFSLARGYGISLAFLMMALWQTAEYSQHKSFKALLLAALAFVLALSANLTLIPFVLLALFALAADALSRRKIFQAMALAPFGLVLATLIRYSFQLKSRGKLYYGSQEGLVQTTLQSLSELVLGTEQLLISWIWLLVMVLLILLSVLHFYRNNRRLDVRYLFPVFLALSLLNILAQHILLGINYPEDRTAIYLPLAFLGALVAVADLWKAGRWAAPAGLGMLAVFIAKANLSHTHTYYYEHFDPELITTVPAAVDTIPPTTAARFWTMDNAMNRKLNERILAFQNAPEPDDTLYDYVIQLKENWPARDENYRALFQDSISGLTLYERQPKLKRRFVKAQNHKISGSGEFVGLWKKLETQPRIVRVEGVLEPLDIYSKVLISVSVQNRKSGESEYFESLSLIANKKANAQGQLKFDFSLFVPASQEGEESKVFLWNQKGEEIEGRIEVEEYKFAKD